MIRDQEDDMGSFDGVGTEAPMVVNEKGGKQSSMPARCDLVPPTALLYLHDLIPSVEFPAAGIFRVGVVCKEGSEKYGKDNWRNISVADHVNKAIIHCLAYLGGDEQDDHIGHAATRAMFALELQLLDTDATDFPDSDRQLTDSSETVYPKFDVWLGLWSLYQFVRDPQTTYLADATTMILTAIR